MRETGYADTFVGPKNRLRSLGSSFLHLVRGNPLHPKTKRAVLDRILGVEAVAEVFDVFDEAPPTAAILDTHERLCADLLADRSTPLEMLRAATGHQSDAWLDLRAFAVQASVVLDPAADPLDREERR